MGYKGTKVSNFGLIQVHQLLKLKQFSGYLTLNIQSKNLPENFKKFRKIKLIQQRNEKYIMIMAVIVS